MASPTKSITNSPINIPSLLNSPKKVPSSKSINLFKSAMQDSKPKASVDKKGFITGMGVIKDQATNLEMGSLKKVNAIILHRTVSDTYSKPAGKYGAHFMIDKDGTIYQTASLNQYTQHVGKIKSKCFVNNSCSSKDAKTLKSFGWSPTKIRDHEAVKSYPNRYPSSMDSVGIEVVGDYSEKTKTWDSVTKDQQASVNNLIDFLEKKYSLGSNDRYNHEDISYKTAGEGSTVEKIVID